MMWKKSGDIPDAAAGNDAGVGVPTQSGISKPRPSGNFLGTLVGFLIVGGIIALIGCVYLLLYGPNVPQADRDLGILVILLLGSFGMTPPAIIFCMVFLHPTNSIKAKRAMTKKNYGYVKLVSRGKVIITQVKDFNNDLLKVGEGLYNLRPNKIFKDIGVKDSEIPINSKHIHTESGIPTIFINIDTMEPLDFFKEEGVANPKGLASTLNGWLMNQLAKNMFFKKTFSILVAISIIVAGAAAVIAWQNHTDIATMMESYPKLVAMSEQIQGIIDAAQKPTVVG